MRRISHADENALKIKGFPSTRGCCRVFPALDLLCFRRLVEWLNRLMRHYTNKSSLPTLRCWERAKSSSGHYGSWNVLCRRVNIWKCRKCDTMPCVDILIKAKGCFGPLSSVENLILGEKYQCQGIRGRGKSNIMFWNIATANSTATWQDYLHTNSRLKNVILIQWLLHFISADFNSFEI